MKNLSIYMRAAAVMIFIAVSSLSAHARKIYPGPGSFCWINGASGYCSPPVASIGPGDSIIFQVGTTYGDAAFGDFHGTDGNPVYIITEGSGIVTMGAMAISNSSNVIIDGRNAGSDRGLNLFSSNPNTSSPALSISGNSWKITARNFQTHFFWSAVMAKQDFSCDETMSYPAFVLNTIILIEIDAYDSGGDTFYLGNTNPTGDFLLCNGQWVHRQPVRLGDFLVLRCRSYRSRRTAFQLGLNITGTIAYCYAEDAGSEINPFQGVGFAIGGSSTNVRLHHDTTMRTFLEGIKVFGYGFNQIDSCVTDSSGFVRITNPFINIDSLAKKSDTMLYNGAPEWGMTPGFGNTAWNNDATNTHFQYIGRTFMNTYSQPAGIAIVPDWARYSVDQQGDPLDSISVSVFDNKVGQAMSLQQPGYIFLSGSLNHRISIVDNNKVRFGYFNYFVGNRAKEVNEELTIETSRAGIHWFTDRSNEVHPYSFPFAGAPPAPAVRFRYPYNRGFIFKPRA